MATIEEITENLSDLTFPATREQIIAHARQNGATEDLLDDLRTLPDETQADIMDIWQQLGLTRDNELSALKEDIETTNAEALEPQWQCPHCEVPFDTELDYREHMQQSHRKSPPGLDV